jgi:hypothetical protein
MSVARYNKGGAHDTRLGVRRTISGVSGSLLRSERPSSLMVQSEREQSERHSGSDRSLGGVAPQSGAFMFE